ncbi:9534_t:CDS:2 [Cetraspora pellucida]|uniref:9534_t:CDS:1 n=1 Tax=Cetraspora pellucida TaxID=1433469 RepID=A0A9N8ZI11_9GLOM|nr:9534_t:CDS:2 [Cetraspora pellucida]
MESKTFSVKKYYCPLLRKDWNSQNELIIHETATKRSQEICDDAKEDKTSDSTLEKSKNYTYIHGLNLIYNDDK